MLLLVLVAVFPGASLAQAILGHSSDDPFPYAAQPTGFSWIPNPPTTVGPWTRVPALNHELEGDNEYDRGTPPAGTPTTLFAAGADGPLGRDELLRLLYGGRVSIEVAVGATVAAVAIGVVLGLVSGWFGGWVDAVVGRTADFVMAFPLLLFLVMVGSTGAASMRDWTLHGVLPPGVTSLVVLIAGFTWFYPARIMRTHVKAVRTRDFVEAARMVGGSDRWIMQRHVLPHLWPPIAVLVTLLVPVNILLEAGLTFLGVGIKLPASSWGTLLADTWGTVLNPQTAFDAASSPWLTVFPSAAIFLTVLAFNQFGEGLRESLDPAGLT